jgi:hypothetical protein
VYALGESTQLNTVIEATGVNIINGLLNHKHEAKKKGSHFMCLGFELIWNLYYKTSINIGMVHGCKNDFGNSWFFQK